MNTLDIRSLLQVVRDGNFLCFMISHELFQDDAIEHVDMEEEAGKEVVEEAAPDLDEGDEVS